MGEPKLLLPWKQGMVIDHVLGTWVQSPVDEVVIVVRKDDSALRKSCEKWHVAVVTPEVDPVDMKTSVMAGMRYLQQAHSPADHDCCFVSPADVPELDAPLITELMSRYRERAFDSGEKNRPMLVVPRYGARPGHPSLFRWEALRLVDSLDQNEGLNRLVETVAKHHVDRPSSTRPKDIDTPEDYQRIRAENSVRERN